jgi:hypothetical protein
MTRFRDRSTLSVEEALAHGNESLGIGAEVSETKARARRQHPDH